MNFNSLISKILFVFIISILLFIAVFVSTYYYEQGKVNKQIKTKYNEITRFIHDHRLSQMELINYIEQLGYKITENNNEILDLMDKLKVLEGPGYEVFKYNDNYYIHIIGPGFRILFKDKDSYNIEYYSFIIITFILFIYVASLLWIIKALKPLKTLKEEIKNFSNGNLNIDCKSDKKDEIAELANEFDNAAKKIALLLNSRQLFLRTIMHELKTPIAKGRIVSELIDDEKQKNRIISIFDKLNYQINNFSKIEEIVSKNYKINKHSISINNIIKNSIDMMLLNNPKNKVEVENISKKVLKVDLDLFSLAIKNLLDNGIKYSIDKKVKILEEDNSLKIISKGEKLKKPLDDYFEAYHNDTKSKNHGMGLGLYIVHEILKMHNINLEYEYVNGFNIFKILL